MKESEKAPHDELLEKFTEIDYELRIDRAISWLKPAETAMHEDGFDESFIFYWVAFNSIYAKAIVPDDGNSMLPERERFGEYFEQILELDEKGRVYDVIWNRFSENIRRLLMNRYVYGPFWQFSNGDPAYSDWEGSFNRSRHKINTALKRKHTLVILNTVFDRLYILRNQLIHGASKWRSSANREQVIDGVRIMESLVPVFIDLMIEHAENIDWGKVHYPYLGD